MNLLEKIRDGFQAQTKTHQWRLIFGLFCIATLTTVLMYWVLSPSYGLLFSHLNTRDANPILTELDSAHIAYQVRNHGHDIFIDKRLIDKTRIQLMGSPLPFTHSVGFELFDKTDFGMTDFSQKINYQRALQGELERTISSLDEVQQARVQLTLPENHLFEPTQDRPRAAVTLHLNRPLTLQQVKSIQQLIVASVAHLTKSNVVMVDQNGNGLIPQDEEGESGHFSAKKKVEHYLNDKVMQMLQPIFTNQTIMVKIDVTLNYDQLQRERENPERSGRVTHEKETRHASTSKTHKAPLNEEVTREKSYQFGHEKEQFTRANGTIERLTVSVVLPLYTTQEKMHQIERLVRSVVGFDTHRGDVISVEALITEPRFKAAPRVIPVHSISAQQKILALVVILAVFCLITIGLRLQRRFQRRHALLAELNQWLTEHE